MSSIICSNFRCANWRFRCGVFQDPHRLLLNLMKQSETNLIGGQNMGTDVNSIQPTPSDFGEFVYCGVKWALNKNRSLASLKKAKYSSYDPSYKSQENYNNLVLGQQNEHMCIDWVQRKHGASLQRVVFNGTGENNLHFLTSEIKPLGINMLCKPDLIISKSNRNLLFEFKAVKDYSYLLYSEFDSVHAQAWCYTTLNEVKIDEYYLLRYFIDPSKMRLTKLTHTELDTSKFEKLFEQYIKAIESLTESNLEGHRGKDLNGMSLDMFNMPNEEKIRKCPGCVWHRLFICKPNL